jgi:hypothetical protein
MLRRVALARTDVVEENRFLQEPHGLTPQKTAFFEYLCSLWDDNSVHAKLNCISRNMSPPSSVSESSFLKIWKAGFVMK